MASELEWQRQMAEKFYLAEDSRVAKFYQFSLWFLLGLLSAYYLIFEDQAELRDNTRPPPFKSDNQVESLVESQFKPS